MSEYEDEILEGEAEVTNSLWNTTWITQYLMDLIDFYGLSIVQQCVSILYAVYLRLTLINLLVFFLKYVPTGIYMYKFIKNIYATSRERLKEKQMELEDIQLQIQIVNTKLCVRDAEFSERAELLQRETERLRRVRARVRDIIASDDALCRALSCAADCESDAELNTLTTPQEDNEFIMEFLKGLKRDQYVISERNVEKMDCGEHVDNDHSTDQSSIYSSLSGDKNVHQDSRVKFVKVTNVYKIAYLKHYIKQMRMRRANKRTALKKKMENMKKLLEDWQKTLSMVINSKLTIWNIDAHPMDVASQEAMGDYSKPRTSSDTDSDMRNEMVFDDCGLAWSQNPYRPYPYNYEDVQEPPCEYFNQQNNGDAKYSHIQQCEVMDRNPRMTLILEETGSQLAVEEISSDERDDAELRDFIAI